MIAAQRHRGPDADGVQVFGASGDALGAVPRPDVPATAGLGHCRLAIIDLDERANQPMCSSNGRYWLVFNGEIYNYLELRRELVRAGVTFRTESDSEVLLEAYVHWGEECLPLLNGMWALAIWDSRERSLFCSRDRLGIKPFHYVELKGGMAFASEIKGLFASGLVRPEFADHAVRAYVNEGTVMFGAETFWENVRQLPGGHVLRLKERGLTVNRWWEPPTDDQAAPYNPEQLGAVFEDAVRIRLRSDVPVGSCMSGGLDSTGIVATMRRLLGPKRAIRSFTAVHPESAVDGVDVNLDRRLAERMVDFGNLQPTWVSLPAAIDVGDLISFILHHDQPLRSSGVYNQYVTMRAIHEEGVKVVLDGQGSDELFLGYFQYYWVVFRELRRQRRWRDLLRWMPGVLRHRNGNLRNMVLHGMGGLTEPLRRLRIAHRARSFLNDPAFHPCSANGTNRNTYEERRLDEITGYHLPWLLRDEDLNSMAFSVEARLPFLDYRIVEAAARLDPLDHMRGGWSKYPVRRMFQGLVPSEIVWNRRKCGFYVDVMSKIVGARDLAREVFASSAILQRVFRRDVVERRLARGTVPPHLLFRMLCLGLLDTHVHRRVGEQVQ